MIAAVNAGRVPPRYQEELAASASSLLVSIECATPAPDDADEADDVEEGDEDDSGEDGGKDGKKGKKKAKGKKK